MKEEEPQALPIWMDRKRVARAIVAQMAAIELSEWAAKDPSIPTEHLRNIYYVTNYIQEVNTSVLHAMERYQKEAKRKARRNATGRPDQEK